MNDFLQRLRERKLVQWLVAYLAAAFALLQGLDIIAQQFGWPEGVRRGITIALAIGFFVTLVLAWYHGERGAQRVSGMELMILALLLAIGGGLLWRMAHGSRENVANVAPVMARAPDKSIAVLPFTDLSPGHDQEYFSDGMAEEILNALAKIKDLKVAGRTSSFSFKGKNEDLRAIGSALGVANVLEGSVRKQGDKVRITAQLIRGEDGFHLWSDAFDGDLSDVFAVQERIARAITDKLDIVLRGDVQKPLVPAATTNAEAYALYLQASGIFNRREGKRFPEAIAELEQALQLDPRFARAHARLASIHALEAIYVPESTEAAHAAAEREAALATQLDPTLAEPHAALAVSFVQQRRFVESRDEIERALALDPNDVTTLFWAGTVFITTGYTAKGIAAIDRVLTIDPLLPNALLWRGVQYAYSGDIDHAETQLRRAADVGLAHAGISLYLVSVARGQTAEALRQLTSGLRVLGAGMPADAPEVIAAGVLGSAAEHAKALALIDAYLATRPKHRAGMAAYGLLLLGDYGRALDMASDQASSNEAVYFYIFWSPAGRVFRVLPEFHTFIHKAGLTQLWDRYGNPDVCHQQTASNEYTCD
jgi:TolB-like protein/Tfp pilus assembly protein PilF